MYSFISPKGEIIKTKTVKEFSEKYGMKYSSAKELACGNRARNLGWCSTHKKAKRLRDRFTTVLVNTKTGERSILGQSLITFSKKHGLCMNEISKLVNGHKIFSRHWCLEKTLTNVHEAVHAGDF